MKLHILMVVLRFSHYKKKPNNYNFILFFFCFTGLALHADYMANMSVLGSRMGELHHSASLLGSTELPFSLDGNNQLFTLFSTSH